VTSPLVQCRRHWPSAGSSGGGGGDVVSNGGSKGVVGGVGCGGSGRTQASQGCYLRHLQCCFLRLVRKCNHHLRNHTHQREHLPQHLHRSARPAPTQSLRLGGGPYALPRSTRTAGAHPARRPYGPPPRDWPAISKGGHHRRTPSSAELLRSPLVTRPLTLHLHRTQPHPRWPRPGLGSDGDGWPARGGPLGRATRQASGCYSSGKRPAALSWPNKTLCPLWYYYYYY